MLIKGIVSLLSVAERRRQAPLQPREDAYGTPVPVPRPRFGDAFEHRLARSGVTQRLPGRTTAAFARLSVLFLRFPLPTTVISNPR